MNEKNILSYMGNTPMVRLTKNIPKNSADIYLKVEEFNPGGSIKSRISLQMIIDAEEKGILKPNSDQIIIEPTGGNTGIGLAIASAIKGYKLQLVIPDNYSKEKIKMLKAYGAEVILSNHEIGNDSHIKKTKKIIQQAPDKYVWLDQLRNPSNPGAHFKSTALEILDSLEKIDCFVAGIGSGGTITGIGTRIKEKFPHALIIAVQPKGCDVLQGKAIKHKIQGFSIGYIPPVLNTSIIDDVLEVDYEDVVTCMKELAKTEGLLLGISSGANVYAAKKMAIKLGINKTIVTISPDSGRSYLEVYGGCIK